MVLQVDTGMDLAFALTVESTFGTAIADGAAMDAILPLEGEAFPSDNFENEVIPRARSKRSPDSGDHFIDTNMNATLDGLGLYFTRLNMINLLKGIFQTSPSTATDPIIQFPTSAAPQPDFTNDEGTWFTFLRKVPVASQSYKMTSAIVNEMVVTCRKDENQGRLTATMNFISPAKLNKTSNPSGTLTYHTETFFNFDDITAVTIDGADIFSTAFYGFTLTLRNNGKPIGWVGTSDRYSTFVLPRYEADLELQYLVESNFYNTAEKRDSSSVVTTSIVLGTAGQAGYFKLDHNGKFQDQDSHDSTDEIVGTITLNGVDNSVENDFVKITYNV